MENTQIEKQNSIKLSKGMNDNYSWEIKLYFDDKVPTEELEKINNQLKIKFKNLK